MRAKEFTVNDLMESLAKLANTKLTNMHDISELREFLKNIDKYLPPSAKKLILINDPCCDTFPWLCDDGC
jgi:hypothetical protein